MNLLASVNAIQYSNAVRVKSLLQIPASVFVRLYKIARQVSFSMQIYVCVCEGSISEEIWYNQFHECQRDNKKIFSIFSCGCECPKYLKCPGKKVIDPNTCRCVCPTSSCTSPKYLDPYTCDCKCRKKHPWCGYGYRWDSNECRCKCQENLLHCWGKKVADLTTCRCVCPETSCVLPKRMNNYTCGCECCNYQRCSHGYQWDRDECRCKCWERTCPHGHKFNNNTCKCESMCPHANTRCHRPYYTFDYDTCQCKCSRTCRDHEVLDSECRCRRKQQPTTTYTSPQPTTVYTSPQPTTTYTSPQPTTTYTSLQPTTVYTSPPTSPPLNTDVCSNLRSYYKCIHSGNTHGVSCRYVSYHPLAATTCV